MSYPSTTNNVTFSHDVPPIIGHLMSFVVVCNNNMMWMRGYLDVYPVFSVHFSFLTKQVIQFAEILCVMTL